MCRRRSLAFALAGCLGLLATGGCTLVKPVTGAIVGPFVILGYSNGDFCGCQGDPRGLLAALAVMSAAGAVVGLVTGVISDVQVLTGDATDPTANWWDPLKTNTSG